MVLWLRTKVLPPCQVPPRALFFWLGQLRPKFYRNFLQTSIFHLSTPLSQPASTTMAPNRHLTTEERQRIRTLYFDGHLSQPRIQETTGYTKYQIRHAIRAPAAEVAPRSGRPRVITADQELELIRYVCESKAHRRMSFLELSIALFNSLLNWITIRNALYRHGFRRRVARKKPPISEANQQKRLAWAIEHKDWTLEQWRTILWSDETWVVGGPHRKQYVTRRIDEEWDPTCIVEKHQRKGGWMFWGCFYGSTKGPGIFWEKEWGSINEYSYRKNILPNVHEFIDDTFEQHHLQLSFMQDGAPGHRAAGTKKDLENRKIRVVDWPPFSPDLNPIESCWNWMKDYIEDKYGLEEKPSYAKLKRYVEEAWQELPESYLQTLLDSMPSRCEAVIAANGMHTKY